METRTGSEINSASQEYATLLDRKASELEDQAKTARAVAAQIRTFANSERAPIATPVARNATIGSASATPPRAPAALPARLVLRPTADEDPDTSIEAGPPPLPTQAEINARVNAELERLADAEQAERREVVNG